MNRMLQWFQYTHLPEPLQEVAAHCAELAKTMDSMLPESAEKTAGLRKLLEAKDCFVRAALEQPAAVWDEFRRVPVEAAKPADAAVTEGQEAKKQTSDVAAKE